MIMIKDDNWYSEPRQFIMVRDGEAVKTGCRGEH